MSSMTLELQESKKPFHLFSPFYIFLFKKVCFAAIIELQEALDHDRMTEAWKKTRSQEPFLRSRSEDKFVTTVPLELCQGNACKLQ